MYYSLCIYDYNIYIYVSTIIDTLYIDNIEHPLTSSISTNQQINQDFFPSLLKFPTEDSTSISFIATAPSAPGLHGVQYSLPPFAQAKVEHGSDHNLILYGNPISIIYIIIHK